MKGETYSLSKIKSLLDNIDKIALTKQYEFINASTVEKINNDKIDFEINIPIDEKFNYLITDFLRNHDLSINKIDFILSYLSYNVHTFIQKQLWRISSVLKRIKNKF